MKWKMKWKTVEKYSRVNKNVLEIKGKTKLSSESTMANVGMCQLTVQSNGSILWSPTNKIDFDLIGRWPSFSKLKRQFLFERIFLRLWFNLSG